MSALSFRAEPDGDWDIDVGQTQKIDTAETFHDTAMHAGHLCPCLLLVWRLVWVNYLSECMEAKPLSFKFAFLAHTNQLTESFLILCPVHEVGHLAIRSVLLVCSFCSIGGALGPGDLAGEWRKFRSLISRRECIW